MPAATSSSAVSCTSVRSLPTTLLVCAQTACPCSSRSGIVGWRCMSWRGCIRQMTDLAPRPLREYSVPRVTSPSCVISVCRSICVSAGSARRVPVDRQYLLPAARRLARLSRSLGRHLDDSA